MINLATFPFARYADRRTLDVGLLFATRLGGVELDRPVALLQHHLDGLNSGEPKVEATLMAQQTPAQRDLVRQLQPQAAHGWWLNGHPGWAIFPMDSDQFIQVRAWTASGKLLLCVSAVLKVCLPVRS